MTDTAAPEPGADLPSPAAHDSSRTAEQRMQVALEASGSGTFYWDIRTNALWWDHALDKLFGLRPGEKVRSLPQFVELVHPDDRAQVIARCIRCKEEGADFEMEFRVVHPDGSLHWLHDRGRTFTDAQGQALYMTGACVDFTERRKVREALRQSEAFYRGTLESVPGFTFSTTESGDCDYLSSQWSAYTGVESAAHLGRRWMDALHPDDMPAARDAWEAAVRTRTPYEVEYRIRRHDGKYHWFKARGCLVDGVQGQPARWAGTILNIDDLKQAQGKVLAREREKDAFLATLAHELRNPLAPLRSGIGVLQRGTGQNEQARVLAIMERQVNHMVQLVDDLLDLARIGQGKIVLRREVLLVREAIEQAVEATRALMEAQGHDFAWDADPRALVHGDVTRLAQVVGNLLTNAAKYTPPGGRVRLRTMDAGDEVCIVVEDDGVGIPADMLARVFERFVQVHADLETSNGGMGIGLSVVRSVVEMHGGRVAAESAGAGRGTTMRVWLPRAPEAQPRAAATAPAIVARSAAPKRVLIVDDNVDAAETLAMLAELHGHEIRVVNDGPGAIVAAQEHEPQIVFMDIGMPGMSGYEVATHLRTLPGWADRVLVALTGWGTEEDRARSLAAGFDVHLAKPVDLAVVEKLLGVHAGP